MKPDVSPTNETASADHFCSLTKMIPLTPEQIKSMDWHRVWISYDDQKGDGEWGIVLFGKVYSTDTLDGAGLEDLLNDVCPNSMDMNEKTCRVFGKPPHIDPEAWTAEWVKHDGYTECSKCEHWYDSPENEDAGDRPTFCPSCGRAMTTGAWAALEKRLMELIN